MALLRRLRGHAKPAIVSNAWSGTRARTTVAGMLDIADEMVLSCEVGYAKPDRSVGMTGHLHTGTASTITRIQDFLRTTRRIYQAALRRLAATSGDALFIDDTPGHITNPRSRKDLDPQVLTISQRQIYGCVPKRL